MNYKLLVIGVLLVGFGIVAFSIYTGVAVRDMEVADNAYETGLKFDEIARKHKELGWKVELPRTLRAGAAEATTVTVSVTGRSGAVPGATVDVTLNRMGSRNAKTYRCSGGKDGRYTASATFDAPGYWDARVRVAHQGESLTFDDQINIIR